TGRRHDPKLSLSLPAGARFTLELPGGGGFYDPRQRDPERVAEDVAEGLVSPAAAERDYGLDPGRAGGRRRRPPSRRIDSRAVPG
ncbi:MAG TPA: hypothetical protein VFD01_20880, partial [Candidatus Dormibacteraeota bacterium]|nr:hypothetical protein [Candidatus Dormibacteraeota bacterium]